MKAFLVTARGVGNVQEVPAPVAAAGQVVVDVARVGLCGTDLMLFGADEAQLRHRRTAYPLRLGHEWSGRVSDCGARVDPRWRGRRVTGDTMLGCGVCERCRKGHHHVCAKRYEVGVVGGWPGALAEQLVVPASSLHLLPDAVTDEVGAMVEPGGNAYRAALSSDAGEGARLLVLGPGTIGLLAALIARSLGAEVHVLGPDTEALRLARRLGFAGTWTADDLPALTWDAVIDATNSAQMPAFAADVVEPAGRVVYIGISATRSMIDTRTLVRKDVTAVGVLGGSAGLDAAVAAYADGTVDPTPLIRETVGLGEVADVLAGRRSGMAGDPPKILVDPSR